MVLCLQRSHTRGVIFDSPEFANSIGWFCETGEAVTGVVGAQVSSASERWRRSPANDCSARFLIELRVCPRFFLTSHGERASLQ
jgi:hypothetical protein